MKTYLRSVLIVVPLALAACAQTEPPRPLIRGEPIYSKYGDVIGCEQGRYIPGAPQRIQCLPPEECDEIVNAAGWVVDCRPPDDECLDVIGAAPNPNCPPDQRDDDNGGDRGRTPNTPPGTPGTPTRVP